MKNKPVFFLILLFSGCASTMPDQSHRSHSFPTDSAYVELPTGKNRARTYEALGWVKTKVVFPTLDQDIGSPGLCKNYYNKGVHQLLEEAKKAKGEAIIQIRSVVMHFDGSVQEYKTAECADDGGEGEILLKAVAIRYKDKPKIEVKAPTKKDPDYNPSKPLTAPTVPSPNQAEE